MRKIVYSRSDQVESAWATVVIITRKSANHTTSEMCEVSSSHKLVITLEK